MGEEGAALMTAVESDCAGGRWQTADGGLQMADSGQQMGDHIGRQTTDGRSLFPSGCLAHLRPFHQGGINVAQ